MAASVLLVVDPRPERRSALARLAREAAALVVECAGPEQALAELGSADVACAAVAVDPPLLGAPRLAELIAALRQREISPVCYADGARGWSLPMRCRLLTWGADLLHDTARAGAWVELSSELRVRLAALAERQAEHRRIQATMAGLGVVGHSQAMIRVFRSIRCLAPLSDLPVLVRGETGTGKELVARALHELDPVRRDGPMVAVNCAALPRSLAESELFGHRRGAFTGADARRAGLIRSAHGGVLLLDEVGELDLDIQSKLLRVLQEGRVLSVGDDVEHLVDVRMIAATHRDLVGMVQAGRFREDLFHRMSVVPLRLPPLRDRPGDVGPLVDHLLRKHAGLRRSGPAQVAPEFVHALELARLPGNVRQLENIVRCALAQAEHDRPLGLTDLPPEVLGEIAEGSAQHPGVETPGERSRSDLNLARALESCEQAVVREALACARGSQAGAARLLGITSRSVYTKVRKYGLEPRGTRPSSP